MMKNKWTLALFRECALVAVGSVVLRTLLLRGRGRNRRDQVDLARSAEKGGLEIRPLKEKNAESEKLGARQGRVLSLEVLRKTLIELMRPLKLIPVQ